MMVMARRRHDGRGRRRSGSGRPSYAGGAYSTQQPQPSVRARELHAVGLDPGEHDALDEAADVCHQQPCGQSVHDFCLFSTEKTAGARAFALSLLGLSAQLPPFGASVGQPVSIALNQL